jgi:hypothetical protein
VRTIDLSKITPFKDNKDFIELSSKIQDILFKNPVALNIALNILEITFMRMMFDEELIDLEDADIYTALISLQMVGETEEYNKLLDSAPEHIKEKLAK